MWVALSRGYCLGVVLSRGVARGWYCLGCHPSECHPGRGGVLVDGRCPRGRVGVQREGGGVGGCPGVWMLSLTGSDIKHPLPPVDRMTEIIHLEPNPYATITVGHPSTSTI